MAYDAKDFVFIYEIKGTTTKDACGLSFLHGLSRFLSIMATRHSTALFPVVAKLDALNVYNKWDARKYYWTINSLKRARAQYCWTSSKISLVELQYELLVNINGLHDACMLYHKSNGRQMQA